MAPPPNYAEYSQHAFKATTQNNIYDENGNVINTIETKVITDKANVVFDITNSDGYTSIDAVVNDKVVWSTSTNPDAVVNDRNTSFNGMSDVRDIESDIFNNFYNY